MTTGGGGRHQPSVIGLVLEHERPAADLDGCAIEPGSGRVLPQRGMWAKLEAGGERWRDCPGEKGQRPLHDLVDMVRYGRVNHIKGLGGSGVSTLGSILLVIGVVTDGAGVAALGAFVLVMDVYARTRQDH